MFKLMAIGSLEDMEKVNEELQKGGWIDCDILQKTDIEGKILVVLRKDPLAK